MSVAGWLCPKHHIRRNVWFLLADREKEDREGPRDGGGGGDDGDETRGMPRQEPPLRLSSAASNIRCTSRHQISRLPPAASARAQRDARVHFPFLRRKGCVGCVFIRGPFSDVSRSFRTIFNFSRWHRVSFRITDTQPSLHLINKVYNVLQTFCICIF